MTMVHLMVGRTGAGKTHVAHRLEQKYNAVRFSIDEWMATLFMPDAGKPTFEWMMERISRCETLIWKQTQRLIELQREVILDLGFSTREHRLAFRQQVRDAGGEPRIHWVEAPLEVRRRRVVQRNEGESETFAIAVSDEVFDWMEDYFENLDEEEKYAAQFHDNG